MNNEKSASEFAEALKELSWFVSLVFIALRACDVINWHWIWLLSPILGLWAIGIVLVLIAAAIGGKNE